MKRNNFKLSDISVRILYIGFNVILAYFLYILISMTYQTNVSRNVLIHIYTPQIEYILATFCSFVIGAIIFDITKKEIDFIKKQ